MNGLEPKLPELNPKNIKNGAYLNSLADEARRCGAMSDGEFQLLQLGLYEQLGQLITMYTEGESTSVMTETATELALALTYDIDAYLLAQGSHTAALALIKTVPAGELYVRGLSAVKLLVLETTSLLVKARRTRINLPNYEYNNALDVSIPEMLRCYNVKFSPHRLGVPDGKKKDRQKQKDLMLDYPLALPVVGAHGIYYLKNYLLNLCNENKFCRDFSQGSLASLYKRFCDTGGEEYQSALVNIYTLAILNAVFADYLKKEHGTLALSDDDIDIAQKLLLSFDAAERASMLKKKRRKALLR